MNKKNSLPLHILPETQFLAVDEQIAFGEHFINHRIDFYAIIWFTQDQDIHYIDFEPFPIKKNVVYLLAKNQVHSIPSQVLPNARIIVFSDDFFHALEEAQLKQLFLPFENEGISIPAEMIPYLENLFSLIIAEFQGDAEISLLIKYTSAFLLVLRRFAKQRSPMIYSNDTRIMKLLSLIEQHFREHQPVSFYADQIGLTPKRTNEILKEILAVSVNQLCQQLLLLESKRALYMGTLSVKEIAYQLGFSDQSYFSRFFRKHSGTTPEQFRKNFLDPDEL